MASNPMEQFTVHKIGPEIKIAGIDLSFTNASLFMVISASAILMFLFLGSKEKKISWIHVDDAANFIKVAITNENYKGAYNLATTEPITQEMFIKKIKEKLFPYALIIRIPLFLIRLVLGKRSQIINTDVAINVNKLKKEGFIWKFYNFNKVLEKVRNKKREVHQK